MTHNSNPVHVRAAIYVRVSTDHLQYSASNQDDTIREHAARNGYAIAQIYLETGSSSQATEPTSS